MNGFITSLGLATLLLSAGAVQAQTGTPAVKQSQDICNVLWAQASAEVGDYLTVSEAEPFIANFAAVDTDLDDKISHEEFIKACGRGLISTVVKD